MDIIVWTRTHYAESNWWNRYSEELTKDRRTWIFGLYLFNFKMHISLKLACKTKQFYIFLVLLTYKPCLVNSYLQEITSHFRNLSKQIWRILRGSFKHIHCPREWDKYIKINVSLNRKLFLSESILLLNETAWWLNYFSFKTKNGHMSPPA